jgi:hypothetical protein
MNALRLFGVAALVVLGGIGADARCLRVDRNPDCPDAGSYAYYQDDNNGRLYLLMTRCDGSTCITPSPARYSLSGSSRCRSACRLIGSR